MTIDGAMPDKPYHMCKTFRDHNFSLVALSETRWRDEGIIDIDEYQILFSGLPANAPVALPGVGIALNKSMQLAWNAAGRVLDTRGGRLMRITLLLAKRTYHVISVYAHTFRASESEKEQFYKDLHNMTALCKSGEELILLGDFNARVGIGEPRIDAADGDTETLLGSFGLPEINDNGRLLLDFCRQQGPRPSE